MTLPEEHHCVAHPGSTSPLRTTLYSMYKNVFSTRATLEDTRYRRRVSALIFACGGSLISILNAARVEVLHSRHYRTPISIPSSETCCESLAFITRVTCFPRWRRAVFGHYRRGVGHCLDAKRRVFFLFSFPCCLGGWGGGCQMQPLQMIRAVKVNSVAHGSKHLSRRFRRKRRPVRCKL